MFIVITIYFNKSSIRFYPKRKRSPESARQIHPTTKAQSMWNRTVTRINPFDTRIGIQRPSFHLILYIINQLFRPLHTVSVSAYSPEFPSNPLQSNNVRQRQRRKRPRKGRSQEASQGSKRQHPRNHQAGHSPSCQAWRRKAYQRPDLRGDSRRSQDLPRECHSRRRHLHWARSPEDRHRHGRRVRAQEARSYSVWLWRLGFIESRVWIWGFCGFVGMDVEIWIWFWREIVYYCWFC